MKLLLTSCGFTNEHIEKAFWELVQKKPQETSLVFIPTAANVEIGDKDWFIEDLINIRKQHFKSVAITDISAVPESIWRPQLEEADVLFFEGGNTYHLMRWVNKSGLGKLLPELLQTKIYVGLSAGSMIAGPDLRLKVSKVIYGEDGAEKRTMKALGLVNFYILPHLNNAYFASRIEANISEAMKSVHTKTYALDDQMAIKVEDGKIELVGNGKYLEFN